MKRLTTKEREIMELYWQHGPMFVKELLEYYDEPRPHFNTLSTTVRILEKKGFLDHKQYGTSYQYFPTITEKEYGRSSLTGIIKDYFNDSYLSAVSAFVKEEKISVDELKELIEKIEQGSRDIPLRQPHRVADNRRGIVHTASVRHHAAQDGSYRTDRDTCGFRGNDHDD